MSLFENASLIVTPNGRKAGKIYALKPFNGSGDLTVVRATTKTEVNASGVIVDVPINVPSFDYTNGSCPSILVEPQRTNLVVRSQEFDNASWTKTAGVVVTANSEISPNGTMTADTINFGASNRFVAQGTSLSTGVVVSGSIYVKGISGQTIQLAVGGVDVLFTLNGNWQKLEATRTSVTSVFNINTFGGATARIISVWGAQLEAGANATSYIPTVASAVTRNADVISKTGIADLIGQTEGTIFVDVKIESEISNFSNIINLGKNTTNTIALTRINSTGKIRFSLWAGGALIFNAEGTTTTAVGEELRLAIKYKSGDSKLYMNGVQQGSSTYAFTFSALLNEININDSVIYFANQQIERVYSVALWKTALTDEQCISLTQL